MVSGNSGQGVERRLADHVGHLLSISTWATEPFPKVWQEPFERAARLKIPVVSAETTAILHVLSAGLEPQVRIEVYLASDLGLLEGEKSAVPSSKLNRIAVFEPLPFLRGSPSSSWPKFIRTKATIKLLLLPETAISDGSGGGEYRFVSYSFRPSPALVQMFKENVDFRQCSITLRTLRKPVWLKMDDEGKGSFVESSAFRTWKRTFKKDTPVTHPISRRALQGQDIVFLTDDTGKASEEALERIPQSGLKMQNGFVLERENVRTYVYLLNEWAEQFPEDDSTEGASRDASEFSPRGEYIGWLGPFPDQEFLAKARAKKLFSEHDSEMATQKLLRVRKELEQSPDRARAIYDAIRVELESER